MVLIQRDFRYNVIFILSPWLRLNPIDSARIRDVMDTLRFRRRDRLAEAASRSPSTKPSSPQRPVLFTPPVLVILLQSVVILTLLWLYLAPLKAPIGITNSSASSVIPAAKQEHETLVRYDCYVTIYAYDRPRQLHALLSDIAREADAAAIRVGVNVIDDNSYGCTFEPVGENVFESSTSDDLDVHLVRVPLDSPSVMPCVARHRFARAEKLLQSRGWRMYVSKYRHARRRYWNLVRMAHKLLHPLTSDHYLFLPDDDRLATGFFTQVLGLWSSIHDAKKLTLMLHVEETRETVPVWTDFKPRVVGGGLQRIGWVESGNFLCTEQFLQFMNWSFPRVPVKRWIDNPTISSGVGSTLSELIHSAGKRMFRTQKSFVAHVGVSLSKMNAEFRAKNSGALLTKYFADGEDRYNTLLDEAATVTASIASQWLREPALHSAVHSLAHQVDHLNVYLNSYDSVPPYLLVPYITVVRSQDQASMGDIGDIGKFFWCNDLPTEFHVTADDDIIYPPDYVSKLLEFWRTFTPPVVVGVHGIRIKQQDLNPSSGRRGKGYYGSREVWMATEDVPKSTNVHIIGTGTMLYRPSDIGNIDVDDVFKQPNMADVWFGLLAQKLQLPMMIIPHKSGWIQEVPGTFDDSIYKRSTRKRSSEKHQTQAAKSIDHWTLHSANTVDL